MTRNKTEIIDLAAFREKAKAQNVALSNMSYTPINDMETMEITSDGKITVTYQSNAKTRVNYTEYTSRQISLEYYQDEELTKAITKVMDLVQKRKFRTPQNLNCPPGCGECCYAYEVYINKNDLTRIANHFGLTENDAKERFVNARESVDRHVLGWLKKKEDNSIGSKAPCIFLDGSKSGEHACSIYDIRPKVCKDYSPIGCELVDTDLWNT